ncbi:hypothetical protein B9Z55_001800 [Caenorhabditis nigoni]|nr:hypothetical protein B9Z55_001800 [Caenorhabditis nigoni]
MVSSRDFFQKTILAVVSSTIAVTAFIALLWNGSVRYKYGTKFHRLIAGNTTVFNEINLPDIKHLMDSYFTFMKSVITIIFATGIIFLLTYSCISSAGRKFLKGLFKATWIIIKLIIYGFIRVPLFFNRLLRGRTLCLCMLITAFCLLPVHCNKDLITGKAATRRTCVAN